MVANASKLTWERAAGQPLTGRATPRCSLLKGDDTGKVISFDACTTNHRDALEAPCGGSSPPLPLHVEGRQHSAAQMEQPTLRNWFSCSFGGKVSKTFDLCIGKKALHRRSDRAVRLMCRKQPKTLLTFKSRVGTKVYINTAICVYSTPTEKSKIVSFQQKFSAQSAVPSQALICRL